MERPDCLELAIRFACGFAFAWYAVGRFASGWPPAVAGLVVGVLAAWLGDRLWHALARLAPWRR
ncbi:MAG TPA: hypothetical protein VFM30_10325 [Steroidobacteraceae bacterium]|nr:hypothetical protein [Steroidobacteraceae bacterium]